MYLYQAEINMAFTWIEFGDFRETYFLFLFLSYIKYNYLAVLGSLCGQTILCHEPITSYVY